MKNNVIAFDRTRKAAIRTTAQRVTAEAQRDNVVSLAEWKGHAHAHRTASGVFFTTGVLTTCGSAA